MTLNDICAALDSLDHHDAVLDVQMQRLWRLHEQGVSIAEPLASVRRMVEHMKSVAAFAATEADRLTKDTP